VLLRLTYLAVTNAFAVLRLLPMSDRDKDVEILALRHQLAVLQRQLGPARARFAPADRAFLAALLQPLSRASLRRLHLIVSPDTVLRWHHDLMRQRPRTPAGPSWLGARERLPRSDGWCCAWSGRTRVGAIAACMASRPCWVSRLRPLKDAGIDPASERTATTWAAAFLRSQADALLACDFIETITPTGQCQYILAVIEHATRRVRVLGTTAHPTATWVTQAARNLVMERWVQTCRHELLDRTLIWNQRHLLHALHEYEAHYNNHRPHQAMQQAAPLRAAPPPITDPQRITGLDIRRHDRLGGIIHEYQHAA
jgi:putative transposase